MPNTENENKLQKGSPSMVETYYKKITRFAEYSWIPAFIKFIYFTGFPLLIILLIATLAKDAFLDVLKRRYEASSHSNTNPSDKR